MIDQNRPRALHLRLLLTRIFGVAEIDEIEVDAFDLSPTQICSAQVRFANLLRGLEMLLLSVIRIETGSTPLARNGAHH